MANQHASPKRVIMDVLATAREYVAQAALYRGDYYGADSHARCLRWAREEIAAARRMIDAAPASTRRRWKAGR